MNPKISLLAALLAIPSVSHSAILLDDTFTDGGFTNGADAQDAEWFKNTTNSTVSVTSDPAMGGNALQFNTDPAFRATTAAIPTSTLVNNGDFIRLSFSFRYVSTPGDIASGLRFGIYSNPVALANTAEDTNLGSGNTAQGYYANFVSGTFQSPGTDFNGNQIIRESGSVSGILGGTDRAGLGLPVAGGTGVADDSLHTASLLITKTSTGYSFVGQLDGNTLATGATTTVYNGFNTIAFSPAGNDINLLLDNVMVEFVPEPSSAGLFALAGLVFGARRRRGMR